MPFASWPNGHMDGPFGVLSIGDDKAGCQAEIGHVNHVHPSFDAIKLISEGRGNHVLNREL